jgi:hypothetical protein
MTKISKFTTKDKFGRMGLGKGWIKRKGKIMITK